MSNHQLVFFRFLLNLQSGFFIVNMQINHKSLENNTDLSVKKSFTVCKQTISKSLINQATRKKVVMQSPHPIYFLKTEKQHNYCAVDSFFLNSCKYITLWFSCFVSNCENKERKCQTFVLISYSSLTVTKIKSRFYNLLGLLLVILRGY